MPEHLNLSLTYKGPDDAIRVALMVLDTDYTTEIDFARTLAPLGVETFTARVKFANPLTPENLRAMAPHIETAARSILPDGKVHMAYYACTSGAVHIGDAAITEAVNNAKPATPVITPTSSASAAFKALKLKRLALFTPYLPETSAPLEPFFEESAGVKVVRHTCLGIVDDRDMAQLTADSLINAAIKADHPDAEALFISCTALRALEVAAEIEAHINKPVITSNLAAIWHLASQLGFADQLPLDTILTRSAK